MVFKSDSFLSRIFTIDTAGLITKSTSCGKQKQPGSVDSFVYDTQGRLTDEYLFLNNYNNKKEIGAEYHYRYPTKDSIESRSYYVKFDKSIETNLSFAHLNEQRKPIEIKYTDEHLNLTSTTRFRYNEHGAVQEMSYTSHTDPRNSYGYTYEYRTRKLTLRNIKNGTVSVECWYNRSGQCTDCISYARPDNFPTRFRYNSNGLLHEYSTEYHGNKGAYWATRRFYYQQ
jgi:hypothetical protein